MRPTPALDGAFASINTWRRGEQRAVHKPLLLLVALGRVQRGEPRLVAFREVEQRLRELLKAYGPYRKHDHPEYPFWRLQNDGFWEVPEADQLETRASNTDAKLTELRALGSGGFMEGVQARLLEGGDSLVRQLARGVLRRHFPESYHAPLATDAGLALEVEGTERCDTALRREVLERTGGVCEVCGEPSLLLHSSTGLQLQFLQWTTHGGVALPANSLALCGTHSNAFGFGALSLAADWLVKVSDLVPSHSPLWNLADHQVEAGAALDPRAIEWHRRQVFKGVVG